MTYHKHSFSILAYPSPEPKLGSTTISEIYGWLLWRWRVDTTSANNWAEEEDGLQILNLDGMAKERGDIGFLAVESCSVDERRKLMKWYQ